MKEIVTKRNENFEEMQEDIEPLFRRTESNDSKLTQRDIFTDVITQK